MNKHFTEIAVLPLIIFLTGFSLLIGCGEKVTSTSGQNEPQLPRASSRTSPDTTKSASKEKKKVIKESNKTNDPLVTQQEPAEKSSHAQLIQLPTKRGKFYGPYTHTIGSLNEHYYLGGPQQARPPDGKFSEGTKVKLLRSAGSYTMVQSETGIAAYVTTGCLKKID